MVLIDGRDWSVNGIYINWIDGNALDEIELFDIHALVFAFTCF